MLISVLRSGWVLVMKVHPADSSSFTKGEKGHHGCVVSLLSARHQPTDLLCAHAGLDAPCEWARMSPQEVYEQRAAYMSRLC